MKTYWVWMVLLAGQLFISSYFLRSEPNGQHHASPPEVMKSLDDGVREFQRGRLAAAVEHYQAALEALPTVDEADRGARMLGLKTAQEYQRFLGAVHDNLGVAFFRMRRFAEAEAAIKKALALDPERGVFYANLGVCYLHWRRFEEAAKTLEEAVKRDLENPENLIHLGNALGQLGDWEQGEKHLRNALDNLPDPDLEGLAVEAWMALGKMFFHEERYPEAVDAFARALQLSPGTSEAWYQLSLILYRLGKKDEARATMARFHTLVPLDEQLRRFRSEEEVSKEQLYRFAALLKRMGLPYQALTQFRKLLRRRPGDFCLWIEVGRLYQTLGGKTLVKAEEAYRRALDLAPSCREAHAELAGLGRAGHAPPPGARPCCRPESAP